MKKRIQSIKEKMNAFSLRKWNFLESVSWSFLGVFINSGIIFAINIFVGHFFGLESYGKYTFVLAVGYILSVLMLLGQDIVSVRYISRNKKNVSLQRAYLSGSFFVVFWSIVLVLFIGIFWSDALSSFFRIQKEMWLWAMLYAGAFSLKMMADSVFRAFHLFKIQAVGRIFESICVSVFLCLAVFFFKDFGYLVCVGALSLGGVLFFLFGALILPQKFSVLQDTKRVFGKFLYAANAWWTSLLSIATVTVDKLIVGYFFGVEMLGMYGAYTMASVVLVTQATNVFSNVLFPVVSERRDIQSVLQGIDKSTFIFFTPLTGVLLIVSSLVLELFGGQFLFSWMYLVLFSLSGSLQFFGGLYKNIAMARGKTFSKLQYLSSAIFIFFMGGLFFISCGEKKTFLSLVVAYLVYSFLFFLSARVSCVLSTKKAPIV